VRVSTLSRFIRNPEKSTRLAKSCFKHEQELEVSLIVETNRDDEKLLQQVDHFPEDLDAFSFGALVDSGSFPARLLLDPRSDPMEGSSSLSSSS
nr:hypothetical protein [Tanacetum cinerariifolium]